MYNDLKNNKNKHMKGKSTLLETCKATQTYKFCFKFSIYIGNTYTIIYYILHFVQNKIGKIKTLVMLLLYE